MRFLPLFVFVLLSAIGCFAADKEPNGPKTPEEERATFTLPQGFEVELVAAEDPANGIGRFVPVAFDQKGALWTTTAFGFLLGGKDFPAAEASFREPRAKDKVLVYDRDPDSPTGYAAKPRVFADGLTIPLGVLPHEKGCFVTDGNEIVFLDDTDNDGESDDRKTILKMEDPKSRWYPHQFLRAPAGRILFAEGWPLARKGGDAEEAEQPTRIAHTHMSRVRVDGGGHEWVSRGSNNIWGLALTPEGDFLIQESADIGYPVASLSHLGTYAGSTNSGWLRWAPEFPRTAPESQMGGHLSGLALTDKAGPFPKPWRDVMLVANPGSQRIQGIKMSRDGTRWRLAKPVDYLVSTDPRFCPVAIAIGPDGCLFIVDRYDPSAPERHEVYGRIWRVKPATSKGFEVPDLTKMSSDQLIGKLGGVSSTQNHLAWQALVSRSDEDGLREKLEAVIRNAKNSAARRIQAFWAYAGNQADNIWIMDFPELARNPNPAVRRALARMDRDANLYTTLENAQELHPLAFDPDPEVRATVICAVGRRMHTRGSQSDDSLMEGVRLLIRMTKPSLPRPAASSTGDAGRSKAAEAYDREYERYLIRGHLSRVPMLVATFLDSKEGNALPVESRLLAALAVEPMDSAVRVSKLLAQVKRPPDREELVAMAGFPAQPAAAAALRSVLSNPASIREGLDFLLTQKSAIDGRKLAPLLIPAIAKLQADRAPKSRDLGTRLAAFVASTTESAVDSLFDGKSLAGWRGDIQLWRVEDGTITGGSPVEMEGRNQFLSTVRSYSNFDLRLKIKITGTEATISSGIQIRSVRIPGSADMSGYLVDCGGNWDGMLYDQSRRDKVVGEPKDMAAVTGATRKGEWNEYRVRAEGARIQTWVNGVPAVDYTETEPKIAQDGQIGILARGGGDAQVQVKEVTIEELAPTVGAPTWEKVARPVRRE